MSLLGVAVGALRAVADTVEKLETGGHQDCPWCEPFRTWAPEHPGGRILPIRISDEVIGKMFSAEGFQHPSKAVYMRTLEDGTMSFFFEDADEVDHLSNRVVQQMVGTALDLAQRLDTTNCDLSPEAIEALAAFKKAARQRLSA